MFCRKCGAKIDDDSKFCVKCGTAVVNQSEEVAEPASTGEMQEQSSCVVGVNNEKKSNKTMLIVGVVLACAVLLFFVFGSNKNNQQSDTKPVQTAEMKALEEVKTYINHGMECYNKREYGNAVTDFNHAIELKPDFPEAYNGRGITYYAMNDYDRAIEDCKKALELKPDYTEAKENLQKAIDTKEEMEEARQKFYVLNVGIMPLGQHVNPDDNPKYLVSPEDVSKYLGNVIEQSSGDPMRVRYEKGTVWFKHNSGEATLNTKGKIWRAIFTKPDVYSSSGIHIGDDIEKVFQKHGQPRRTLNSKKYNELDGNKDSVDVWMVYNLDNHGVPRLGFGIKNDSVTAIALSCTPAGF